ncbi:HAMP domain-containing histidine kinase [Olivibacter sp. SDN3]|uniref:sensor histidine kinase n=1 Tax=Olivibacter sp. SDN3 TaxID=2764720 RepID=UPI001650E2AB|nr:HAMP domain-containing sensor histidine kinase [Olivibacter sp. SDN3]QNL52075.1 HAMP domain-containing histidine kinase [Olivibacter sp. SDN3]
MDKFTKSPFKRYQIISILSLIILLYVQAKLIYNTYELKNNQYNLKEKQLINDAYNLSIRNDKVFPGGQKIIDDFIYRNMPSLEKLHEHDIRSFEIMGLHVCDSIFRELRCQSNMDSVFIQIIHENQLEPDMKYRLMIENISITFDGINYISLYHAQETAYPLIEQEIQTEKGIIIDGTLQNIDRQNLVAGLSVSTPSDHSYEIRFVLYADKDNRILSIFKEMLPTFLLSLFSILFVITIYYLTYRNWLKQKKLTDMKSDFLNSITHEFNTPIATILVANKNLENQEIIADRKNVQPLATIIKRQAIRLQTLINQVLDITSLNKKNLEKEYHNLNLLLEETVNDYQLKTIHEAKIQFVPLGQDKQILLNRFLFTTMLNNILDNAIKYNLSSAKKISITVGKEGENFIIAIKDNGIGMPETIKSRIFDKFYRGKNKLKTSGLGLGLFYVKQTIEAHGWEINIQSEQGLGTEFRIFIPC